MANNPQSPTQWESMTLPPRLPLVVVASNRDGTVTKDARLVNCYIEVTSEGELDIYKRPGLSGYETVAPDEPGRGVYFWQGALYSIFGDALYRDGVLVGRGLDTTNGVYRFDSNLGATPQLIFGNGNSAYAYDTASGISDTLHSIDSNYPAITTKGFAYLNGPIYVMQPASVIWNSANNSVDREGDWDPLNFIRAQIEPDDGVYLTKQLVYVVALKQWTIEYFFDAGNASGSPLQSVQGMKVAYGCAHEDSVQKINDILFFLSIDQTNSLQVSTLDKGAHAIISTPAIDRLLANIPTTTIYSWQLKIAGHSFYIITFKEGDLTLAYDLTQDLWYQWTDANGNYFPIVASAYNNDKQHILQHESDGRLYYINTTSFKDIDSPIVVEIITPSFDANTTRRKQLNTLTVIGDQVDGSYLQIRRTDDDYESWSNWRIVDLSIKKPKLTNCGTFIKRAYHIRHTSDTPFRIRSLEVQYDVGTL